MLSIDERLKLIREVGEEIVKEDELRALLESNKNLIAYDGFEPSGQIHIAQGLLRAININKMIKAGFKFKMLVADWHAMANNKMGGDLEKIRTVGKYFIEVWKASGMNLDKVKFVWASDLVKDSSYWLLVLKIARTNKLSRFIRTAQIMGREESLESLTGAQIMYSCMQTADIFTLGARVTQLGMDQRKVNMLAREIGPQLDPPFGGWKPVVVSHHMLMSLRPQTISLKKSASKLDKVVALKMSKSRPESAIFMTDSPEEIEHKIRKAYCPEGEVEMNPVLEYYRYIVFPALERLGEDRVVISRPKKFGGSLAFSSYRELETAFSKKEVHPLDIKNSLITYLKRLLAPVEEHFRKNENARALLEKVKSFRVTR